MFSSDCHTNLETDHKHLEPMLLLVTGISNTEKKFFPLGSPINAGTLSPNIDSPVLSCCLRIEKHIFSELRNCRIFFF